MQNRCCLMKTVIPNGRKKIVWCLALLFIIVLLAFPVGAINFEVGGKPVYVNGYINQGIGWGLAESEMYDTKEGFQQAIFQFLLETEYVPSPNFKAFVSGSVNADWAYPILEDNSEWETKTFDQSDALFILDDYEDILKEAHMTWMPGNFLFRIGKQIVSWGETDGIRVMDQINPEDRRRGAGTDVEFETTIIPIWLVKAEYYLDASTSWMYDLGVELVYNPNADFIPNKIFATGNDTWGIWAAAIEKDIPVLGRHIIGTNTEDYIEPDQWDSAAHEFGVRLKANIFDTLFTLNYFEGIANSPARQPTGNYVLKDPLYEGQLPIMEPELEGYYPTYRITGLTLSHDFQSLNIALLGGVAPVLRMEIMTGIDNTYERYGYISALNYWTFDEYEKLDDFQYAIGIDWKIKIPLLNPRAYFRVSPQYIARHINNYPSDPNMKITESGKDIAEDMHTFTLLIMTSYMHNKINPMLYLQRDTGRFRDPAEEISSDLIKASVTYEYSHQWNYTLAYTGFENRRYRVLGMNNKDNISFTVSYRF